MNQVMISADSTCDLPVDLQRQRHVYCFALSILLGDTAYADGVEIRPADIYADVAKNHRLPKTAAVPPGVYYDKFKQWTDAGCSVVHIGLSPPAGVPVSEGASGSAGASAGASPAI